MPRSNVKLGQNFLIDDLVINNIINELCLPNCSYIEIGPGRGALTIPLVNSGRTFTAVELDSSLIDFLSKKNLSDKVKFINQDAVNVNYRAIADAMGNNKIFVFGNLPYQIASQLMLKMRLYSDITAKMVFMVQKEVADRIVAKSSTNHYGRLSVMLQAWCHAERLFEVGPESFNPPPKVDSTVFLAVPSPREKTFNMDWDFFEKIVAKSFCHKRKMLYSTFKIFFSQESWVNMGFDLSSRPSNLTVDDYIDLTLELQKQNVEDVLTKLKT